MLDVSRYIRAGLVVAGDVVLIPGRKGAAAVPVRVTRATQGYREVDRGKPDVQRQRRRLEGVSPFAPDRQAHLTARAWLRPFGELLEVISLVTDDPKGDPS